MSGKDRPSQLPVVYDGARAHIARRSSRGALVAVGVAFTGLTGCGAMTLVMDLDDLFGLALTLGIMGSIFGGMALLSFRSGIRAMQEKLAFAEQIRKAFADDLHPAGKVQHYLDLRPYDTSDKQTWSGKSAHGNAKYKYTDRWYSASFFLSDGTRVRVERRADVKVRKGNVVKNKRRLYLRIYPNPNTFGAATHSADLDAMVKQTIVERFHDPPEALKVHGVPGQGCVALKITQLDAEIFGEEVLALVDAVLLYLKLRA